MSKDHKTQITVAFIGVIGIIFAAIVGNFDKIFSSPKIQIVPVGTQHIAMQPKIVAYPFRQGELIEKINLNLNYKNMGKNDSDLFILSDYISYYFNLHRCFDSYRSAKLSDLNLSAVNIQESSDNPNSFHVVIPCRKTGDCASSRLLKKSEKSTFSVA